MIRARFVFISFIVFSFQGLIAQKVYTLEDAVAIALKNNYGILMAKNDSALSANEWFVGNAGMLPSIGFNAGINRASNNLNQRFSTGLEVNKNEVGSANTTAAIALGWTVFDGFKMFASYHKLESLYEGGKLQLKTIAENTTQNTIQLYQNCIQVKQKSKTIESLIVIFEERLKIANKRLEIGNGNKSEVLQAQLDLNAQKSALIQARIEADVIKQDLANEMGLGDVDFEIQDSYNPAAINETLQQYAERLNKNNPEILLA
ncbi:MAG: TolC family protein [Bacteroidia bacterium]|nr:TolC family protein [Bacteroidia bacterium]